MRISNKDLQGLLPNLKGLQGVNPQLILRLEESFRRLYEIMNFSLNELKNELNSNLNTKLSEQQSHLTSLIGNLSQPVIGGTPDPVLHSIASLPISSSDVPPASRLNADGTVLDINSIIDGEFLRRTGSTIVSGFPVGTTSIADTILTLIETTLYTTPSNHKTKVRNVLLFNNSAGALIADVLAKDPSNNIIYDDTININSQQKIILTLNIILPANYTFRGFASAEGAIEISIFGIEQDL